jgi:PAS domain S-box-containing protein
VVGEEMQVLRPNSSRGSIVASSGPIRNESGNIVAGVVVLTDITERKRAEEQLQRWGNIFRYGGWGIAISSADGKSLEMLNPTFAQMHGYGVEDMTGTPIVDIFAPEVRTSLAAHWRIANEAGHHTFESIQIRKDGTHFPVLVDLTAIKDEQARVLYRVANVIDLTERKQQEAVLRAQEKRLAALEAIVGERERIGRDLHDGVAQVMGYMRFKLHAVGDLLSRGDIAQARESVVELEESARMANADIREAIAGLRISSVLRSGFMATLTEYLNRYSQQWGIEAEIVIDPGAPTSFTPNASVQLQSIVHEAMSNIRKHAQAQHATVRFAQAGEGALISITDDGQGFDQRRSGGQTYGMGIMRERASLIDADLHIVSRPGEGTRITIHLPKAAVVEEN